jgi:hypothetical protein
MRSGRGEIYAGANLLRESSSSFSFSPSFSNQRIFDYEDENDDEDDWLGLCRSVPICGFPLIR